MKITLFFVAKETMVRCLSFANCAGLNDGRLEVAAVQHKRIQQSKTGKNISLKINIDCPHVKRALLAS